MAKRRRRRKSELLDREAFTAYVEAATRQAGYEVVKREEGVLHIVVHDEPMRCKLDTIYQAYLNSPPQSRFSDRLQRSRSSDRLQRSRFSDRLQRPRFSDRLQRPRPGPGGRYRRPGTS